jgi:hypothetical protein
LRGSRGGWGVWSLETGDLAIAILSTVVREPRYDVRAIPPGATAQVSEVHVEIACDADDGTMAIDFASAPTYSIRSCSFAPIDYIPRAVARSCGAETTHAPT